MVDKAVDAFAPLRAPKFARIIQRRSIKAACLWSPKIAAPAKGNEQGMRIMTAWATSNGFRRVLDVWSDITSPFEAKFMPDFGYMVYDSLIHHDVIRPRPGMAIGRSLASGVDANPRPS